MKEHIEAEHSRRFVAAKKFFMYATVCLLAVLFTAYVMICWSIRSSVRQISAEAVSQYPGDRIVALMSYVDSDDHSLRQRNRAVWALGQIGDPRALATLTKWYTGQPCDHDKSLCQRELAKAIKACNGAFNATAWLPR
jgi:HEAT repeat protein